MSRWLNQFRRKNEQQALVRPDYSVAQISEYIRSVAHRYNVEEAYLMIPPLEGIDSYRPEAIRLIYVLGDRASFGDFHAFEDDLNDVFMDQVRPIASGPYDGKYHNAVESGLRIL